MKKLVCFIGSLLLVAVQIVNGQIKNLHDVAHIIPASLVKEKQVGDTVVKFVEEQYLKEGWNEFSNMPGRFVYVNYIEGKVRGFYISDTRGQVQSAGLLPVDNSNGQYCMFGSCLCLGEKECATLFTINKQKYNPACAGKACIFSYPFDASAHKKDYLEKIKNDAKAVGCNYDKITTLQFSGKAVFLSKKMKRQLDSLYVNISKSLCRIEVIAYDVNCEICQQVSWDRTYSVFKYLRGKGIDSLRFILRNEEGANPQQVTIHQGTDWDYPIISEPPIPCYSYHRLTKKRCKGHDLH